MKELKVSCNRCKCVHVIPVDNKPIPPGERWGFLQGWGLFAREVPNAAKQPMTVELCPSCAALFLAWVQEQPKTVEVVITDAPTMAAKRVRRRPAK